MGVRVFGQVIFDGVNLIDFGVTLSGTGAFNTPERDVEYMSIPGKNGDLIFDNGRYKNITVSYPVNIETKLPEKVKALSAFLMSHRGYFRLEDSYHPDEFRLAQFAGPIEIDSYGNFNKWGTTTLTFICKPQRFLKSGEIALPQIDGAGTPANIIVAEGFAQDVFNSAFISAVGAGAVGNDYMTVFNLSSYQGKKLVLYYPESRIMKDAMVLGGTMSTNPTTGSGGSVLYGGAFWLYDKRVIALSNITSDYAAFETPEYFEILNSDDSLNTSIYPSSQTIINPTDFPAKPLIKLRYLSALTNQPVCMINGSPITLNVATSVSINGASVSINEVIIDCETMDAYTPLTGYTWPYNQNPNVYMPSDITLKPGENEIKYNNKLSYIEIIPKWWRL